MSVIVRHFNPILAIVSHKFLTKSPTNTTEQYVALYPRTYPELAPISTQFFGKFIVKNHDKMRYWLARHFIVFAFTRFGEMTM